MAVINCHICDEEHVAPERRNPDDYAAGEDCPICYRPTCRRHLSVVRWRWRNASRETASARICRNCFATYRHRRWDTMNREWMT